MDVNSKYSIPYSYIPPALLPDLPLPPPHLHTFSCQSRRYQTSPIQWDLDSPLLTSVRACGRACVRACGRACVRACVRAHPS